MKISKVDNAKVAISGGTDGKTFLYKNPARNETEKNIDIANHIKERIIAGNKLNKPKGKPTDKDKKKIRKWNKKKEIIEKYGETSIRHQNLVIQPLANRLEDSRAVVLAPAVIKGASTQKAKRKEAFRNFFFDFAVLDESRRTEMLWKIRRLVLVYFYGDDSVKDTLGKSFEELCDNHKKSGDNENLFVNVDIKSETFKKDLRRELNSTIVARYKSTMDFVKKSLASEEDKVLFFEDMDFNDFWIEHIEKGIKRLFNDFDKINKDYKLKCGYISEKIWKDIINYMSIKYVAVGKTVYNTAMSNVAAFDENGVKKVGVVDDKYADGISSFEFENIKAEESFQRELSMYINFAIRHLTDATIVREKGKEDILSLGNKKDGSRDYVEFEKVLKEDPERNILQFFGGRSRWVDEDKNYFMEKGFEPSKVGVDIVYNVKEMLGSFRNETFHFADNINKETKDNNNLIGIMLESDASEYDKVVKDKFYSNNVPMFYSLSDIEKLLDSLYTNHAVRATQMPSFGNIIKTNALNDFLTEKYFIKANIPEDKKDMWLKALYYVLKEIYYNSFICDDSAKNLFISAINKLYDIDKDDEKHKNAVTNFRTRIGYYNKETNKIEGGITKYSLSEICQIIMTDYNQQNNQKLKKESAKSKRDKKGSYEHYKVLLYKSIEIAFADYLKENDNLYSFLKKPSYKDLTDVIPVEDFLPNYTSNRFSEFLTNSKEDCALKKWYVLGKMLSPKQLNQLVGSIKTYIGYKADVIRRANETDNPIEVSIKKDEELKNALTVLEMCVQLSGRTTNIITDYFSDEEEFAEYVKNFLDFDDLGEDHGIASFAVLKDFCMREVTKERRVGIFYDGKNPIINRNIILSKIYGSSDVFAKILGDSRVKYSDIEKYYNLEKEIGSYKSKGKCISEDLQKKVKKYQELKNHVEFRNLVDYAELLDELLGQLIKWSYLRERDLMYFQLGFHYACLNNDSEKPEGYKRFILSDGKVIDGAILYNLVAMNTYDLPLYFGMDDKGEESIVEEQYSNKFRYGFRKYSNLISGENDLIYEAGLELFEVLKEHVSIINWRDYIEHFHYYYDVVNNGNTSILDIYSEVFDRFFTYDMKLHKNIPNVLSNILLGHFIKADFTYDTKKKTIDKKDATKDCAAIRLKKRRGICSELFTYKLKIEEEKKEVKKAQKGDRFVGGFDGIVIDDGTDEKKEETKEKIIKVIIPARDKEFVMNVAKLLCYPHTEELTNDCYYVDKLDSGDNGNKKNNNTNTGKGYNSNKPEVRVNYTKNKF